MQRTITLHLPADKSLVKTIEAVNVITNDIMTLGFHAKVINKTKLHHLTYYPTREGYPEVPSNLVCAARDAASEMLKRENLECLPLKRQHAAERAGKAVLLVKSNYTSQTCSRCGAVRKANRQGHRHKCKACGFELHSDLNAARNIARLGITEASRPPVNRPNVAGGEA